jgi:hypothetical protein
MNFSIKITFGRINQTNFKHINGPCFRPKANHYIVVFDFTHFAGENISLKGQCHEMVIEMSPWSSILGLNK